MSRCIFESHGCGSMNTHIMKENNVNPFKTSQAYLVIDAYGAVKKIYMVLQGLYSCILQQLCACIFAQ